jgi:hypothetical protein
VADPIPNEIVRFIHEYIDSVEQLEVLLLLRSSAPSAWTAEAVARDLRTAESSVTARLKTLHAQKLVEAATAESGTAYRYAPDGVGTDRLVGELASEYALRRVAVITLIFSKPNDAVRSFADAFRIRKDEDG